MEDAEKLANPAIEKVWSFGPSRIVRARINKNGLQLFRDDGEVLSFPQLVCGTRSPAALAASIVMVSAKLGDPRTLEDLVFLSTSLTAHRLKQSVRIRPVIHMRAE